MSESVSKLTTKSFHALKKLSAPHKYKTALVHQQPVFHCEVFVKKIPRPKHCKARPTIQRIQDLQSGGLAIKPEGCQVVEWSIRQHSMTLSRPVLLPHSGAGCRHLGKGEALQ